MDCVKHIWLNVDVPKLSVYAAFCTCKTCGKVSVYKCADKQYSQRTRPIVANEVIAGRLLNLLHKHYPDMLYCNVTLEDVDGRPCSVIEARTNTTRVNRTYSAGVWPKWLYDFDRWIGRLDADGDSNLLITTDGFIIPIDWGLSFTWAGPMHAWHLIRQVDALDVPCHTSVVQARDPAVAGIIRAIPEQEIFDAVYGCGLPETYISGSLLTAFFTGLCYRRKIL